jgi:hypothetical protein
MAAVGDTTARSRNTTGMTIQSKLYKEITVGTKIKWPYKTGDLFKEVQFI